MAALKHNTMIAICNNDRFVHNTPAKNQQTSRFKIRLLTLLLCYALCGHTQSNTFPPYKLSREEDSLFTLVQRQTFQYFWEGAEPVSGMARERIHEDNNYPEQDQNIITSGGSGFGIMALVVGMERQFITRDSGIRRFEKILHFLETADRYHGVFPHWWNGETGKTKPFSTYDDGADLVETSYLMQGLLCARQYFNPRVAVENKLIARINRLWKAVEYDWFQQGQHVLYWHWSPRYGWKMNFAVRGYNECLILYVLAAASPTHPINPNTYHEGWAEKGAIIQKKANANPALQFRHQGDPPNGGPLFWAHYSFLGLDPRGLRDAYGHYGKEVLYMTRLNYDWCIRNPLGYKNYGPDNWGLTASYSTRGYAAHAPDAVNDLGVISPTAALSSFPYSPKESLAAMRNWILHYNNRLWGRYGFYDAFSEQEQWFPPHYLAIDQGPVVVMMENYRSRLCWNLLMSCPEIQQGLRRLGFKSPWLRSSKRNAPR